MVQKTYMRKLQRTSTHSFDINIPKEIVDELGLKERQKLVVKKSGSKIVIEDWKGK